MLPVICLRILIVSALPLLNCYRVFIETYNDIVKFVMLNLKHKQNEIVYSNCIVPLYS